MKNDFSLSRLQLGSARRRRSRPSRRRISGSGDPNRVYCERGCHGDGDSGRYNSLLELSKENSDRRTLSEVSKRKVGERFSLVKDAMTNSRGMRTEITNSPFDSLLLFINFVRPSASHLFIFRLAANGFMWEQRKATFTLFTWSRLL